MTPSRRGCVAIGEYKSGFAQARAFGDEMGYQNGDGHRKKRPLCVAHGARGPVPTDGTLGYLFASRTPKAGGSESVAAAKEGARAATAKEDARGPVPDDGAVDRAISDSSDGEGGSSGHPVRRGAEKDGGAANVSGTVRGIRGGREHHPLIGTSSAAAGELAEDGGAFVRNKVEYERSVRMLQEMQRAETIGRAGDVAESLSIVLDTSLQNEATIGNLQRDLVRLTKEGRAARGEAEAARGEAEGLADELRRERFAFAGASHRRKKEVEGWKRTAQRLARRCKRLERELREMRMDGTRARAGHGGFGDEEAEGWKRQANELEERCDRLEKRLGEKEAVIKLWKVRRARERGERGGEADATASSAGSSAMGTVAAASSDAALQNEQAVHGPNRERSVGSHGRYEADITLREAASDGPSLFGSDDGNREGDESADGADDAEGEWSDREIRARAKMLLRRANRSEDDRSSDEEEPSSYPNQRQRQQNQRRGGMQRTDESHPPIHKKAGLSVSPYLPSRLRKPTVPSLPPRSLAEATAASGLKGGLGWIREAGNLELTGKNTSDDLRDRSKLERADEDPPPRDVSPPPPLRRLSSLTSCNELHPPPHKTVGASALYLPSRLRKPSNPSSPPRSLAEETGAGIPKGRLGWIQEANGLELVGKNTSGHLRARSALDRAAEDPPPRDMSPPAALATLIVTYFVFFAVIVTYFVFFT